jgi:hypothetical protein
MVDSSKGAFPTPGRQQFFPDFEGVFGAGA